MIRSMLLRRPLRALTAALALSCAASGCSDGSDGGSGESGGGTESPDGPDATPSDPNGPPQAQPTTCGDFDVWLVKACNLVDTYAENTKNGPPEPGVDPYRPTEACKSQLASWVNVASQWNEMPESRDALLAALHVLFFHPLAMPKDRVFLKSGAPTFAEGEMASAGVIELAESPDIVVTRKTYNEKLMHRFGKGITKISPMDSTANMATSFGGLVEVDYVYAKKAWQKNNVNELANKYIVARSLYHELRHTEGYAQHTSCSDIFVNETECDDTLDASGYGGGAQIGQALALGALYGRRVNTWSPVYVGDPSQVFRTSCRYAIERVNDVAKFMEANTEGDPCNENGAIYGELLSKQVKPTAGAPSGKVALPDNDWTCADSIFPTH